MEFDASFVNLNNCLIVRLHPTPALHGWCEPATPNNFAHSLITAGTGGINVNIPLPSVPPNSTASLSAVKRTATPL